MSTIYGVFLSRVAVGKGLSAWCCHWVSRSYWFCQLLLRLMPWLASISAVAPSPPCQADESTPRARDIQLQGDLKLMVTDKSRMIHAVGNRLIRR